MEDLPPGRASFPVFALGPQFTGYRWLGMWSDEELLTEVGLGHGDPDPWLAGLTDNHGAAAVEGDEVRPGPAPWVMVYTYKKSPVRGHGGRGVAGPPVGYDSALSRVLGHLCGFLTPTPVPPTAREDGRELYVQLRSDVEWDNPRDQTERQSRPRRLGDRWDSTSLTLDGHTRDADTVRVNDQWATLVDLPTVAVAIFGPDPMRQLATPLLDARDTLHTYH